MKKTVFVFILLFLTAVFLPFSLSVKADIGPKPSVEITFSGFEGEEYFVTLFSKNPPSGPYSEPYTYDDESYNLAAERFAEYEKNDPDGFYFSYHLTECTRTNRFVWGYYPPETFKITVYFPEKDIFIQSEVLSRYAFDSYFTANFDGTSLKVAKSYDYTSETLSLLARIVLTIAIEVGIAFLFGFSNKKQITFIIGVNIFTQIALNIALGAVRFYSGGLAFAFYYLPFEIPVFIIEGILYSWYLKKHALKPIGTFKPLAYAFAANLASFAAGLGLALLMPGIF
ncbi:MAG: hypothetical protein WC143_03045 [Eubacteriales bacterium]